MVFDGYFAYWLWLLVTVSALLLRWWYTGGAFFFQVTLFANLHIADFNRHMQMFFHPCNALIFRYDFILTTADKTGDILNLMLRQDLFHMDILIPADIANQLTGNEDYNGVFVVGVLWIRHQLDRLVDVVVTVDFTTGFAV